MSWLTAIFFLLAIGGFLPPTNGKTDTKKMLFQNSELLEYFSDVLVNLLADSQLLNADQQQQASQNFRELIENNQGKKASTVKHAFASQIAEIIVEALEGSSDVNSYIEIASDAIANALEDSIGVVDINFIESIRDMVSVMYNNDIEDEIEELQEDNMEISEQIQEDKISQQNAATKATTTTTTTATTQTQNNINSVSTNEQSTNLQVDSNQINANVNQQETLNEYDITSTSEASNYNIQNDAISQAAADSYEVSTNVDQTNAAANAINTSQMSSSYAASQVSASSQIAAQSSASQSTQLASTSQTSSVSQVVSVNYQSIQSYVSSSLQSSSVISSLSSGIISSTDVSSVVASALSSCGVQSGIAQSVASQYVASLGAGASSETYVGAISSAVTEAFRRSGLVTAGQEYSICQSITQTLNSKLQTFISQRTRPASVPSQPAPTSVLQPLPAPIPAVQQQSSSFAESQLASSSQIAAQSSDMQSAQFSSATQESSALQSSGLSDSIDYYSSQESFGESYDLSSTGSDLSSVSLGLSSVSGGNEFSQTPVSSYSPSPSDVSSTPSQLMSPAAAQRISSLSSTLSSALSGGVNYSSLSQALSSVASQISGSSSLSRSEILIEALLETLVAVLELVFPSPSGSNAAASAMAQSLVQVLA